MDILPTPQEILDEFPLSLAEKDFVIKSRQQIGALLTQSDPRLLLIVGPCSIHDIQATYDYAIKLKKLAEEVQESFLIVMRTYFEKPRTALGWRGFLHDPYLDNSNKVADGLRKVRYLLKELTQLELPLACEFLDPATPYFFSDLISWGCIGARTVSSPIHRQLASYLECPVAFKNCTSGCFQSAVLGIEVAKKAHTFIGLNPEGRLSLIHSKGNPLPHLVLRGGERGPNYEEPYIKRAMEETSPILVDCSHDNSRKKPEQQMPVFENVLDQVLGGNRAIRGMMLESFLLRGNQPLTCTPQPHLSITDPCLDFEATQELILKGAHRLQPCALL